MKMLIYIWFMCCFSLQAGWAQTRMQVITRITEETFEFKNDFLLEIDGEKANINIQKGEENIVKVVLKQKVKNVNKELAEQHLEAHKVTFSKERERLYIRNYLLFDSGFDNMSSLFSSEYTITVPEKCFMKIKNTLGDVLITGINGKLSVDIEYGKLQVDQCSLEMDGKVNIGDLNLMNSTLNTDLTLNNVIGRINGSGGNFNLNTSFGSLSFVTTNEVNDLNLSSENTEVTFINKENYLFNYSVKNKNGTINILTNEQIISDGEFKIFKSESNNAIGNIQIIAEYGAVSIY